MNTQLLSEGIDLSYLSMISGGDKAFELSMIITTLDEVDQKFEALSPSTATYDAGSVRLHAHSLKNLFAIIGIDQLRTAFATIEANSSSLRADTFRLHLDHCRDEWRQKRVLLNDIAVSMEHVG